MIFFSKFTLFIELSKESAFQKDNKIAYLNNRLSQVLSEVASLKNETCLLNEKLNTVERELLDTNQERTNLEEKLDEVQQLFYLEKEERHNVETKLEQLELSCRSDKKYRDLKEKLSTYQKEVDSLNVVVDMKTQRTRHLESEIMRIEMELSNYENLKESYQQLQRENEALTETLGMKARKNAEQSREIEHLRTELKREATERKRTLIRNDQLEYHLNETRELLQEMSYSDNAPREIDDCDSKEETFSQSRFNSFQSSVSRSAKTSARHERSTGSSFAVRRLFSSPISHESRQHYQHQDPATDSKHRLPELVLSSIEANWSFNGRLPSSSKTNFVQHSVKQNSHDTSNSSNTAASTKSDTFGEFSSKNASTPSN